MSQSKPNLVVSSATTDAGKVRLGAFAPTLPTTADAGKVRLGAFAPTLPTTADGAKIRGA